MNITKKVLFLSIMTISILSCKDENTYEGIVYKNYLTYEINRASVFLTTTYEGTEEGQYANGSKNAYQEVIDQAAIVDAKEVASQKEVDAAYNSLLEADKVFYDAMVPFRSELQPIINYGEFVSDNTSEGSNEGNVPSGSKEILNKALNDANKTVADPELTQAELEMASKDLATAIFDFNSKIIGTANLVVNNYSFELPGTETSSFDDVPGWGIFGTVEEWAPNAIVTAIDSTTDGDFAAQIGSYTTGIFQSLNELINPSADYTVKVDVSLSRNDLDWEENLHPVIVRTRLITFDDAAGDYNFITVLSESIDTLGLYPTSFIELDMALEIPAVSANIGKRMGVDFILRHTFDAENPIYAESYLSLDKVRLTRKIN